MVWHIGPQIGRVNYENLLFVYILNVLKNLRTVSDLIAKSEKFYAKSEHTKLSWSLWVSQWLIVSGVMLSHLRALRARFIRNIKSLRGTNTTRVNDNHSVVFEPFLRLVITASSSNQNWTWRSQRPHPVASSQCQGLTQVLSPSLIIAF